MCTSLIYRDSANLAYFGRTLELTVNLPYQVAWLPKGQQVTSHLPPFAPLEFTTCYNVLAVTMPSRMPTADAPLGLADLKVLEGLNDQGLTFSLLSYPLADGPDGDIPTDRAVLSASDLGLWALGQFAEVAQVKAALSQQTVGLEALQMLGGARSPFHYLVNDASGASLVIEFHHGVMNVYDNPVHVMTNAPRFDWHLTNLDNYTFLSNVDQPAAVFGEYQATQPDSGVATTGLPGSNTSVGRFVRAAFYAHYAQKATTPDQAINTLAHIMNNFDRPRGITIDIPQAGVSHLEVKGLAETEEVSTEFTCWTSMADLSRGYFYLRTYDELNYQRFDLNTLANTPHALILPFSKLDNAAHDANTALMQSQPQTVALQ